MCETTYNTQEAPPVLLILLGTHALPLDVARAAVDDDARLYLGRYYGSHWVDLVQRGRNEGMYV